MKTNKDKTYVKIGNGEKTMVMLPGLAPKCTLGSADMIAYNYRIFSDYSIYLFDDRNNVKSGYTIRQRAEDVATEMQSIGLSDACVFGASMGGMVGQYLAIDHPELVKCMVLSATCAEPEPKAADLVSKWRALAESGRDEELVRQGISDIYSPANVAMYGDRLVEAIGNISSEELEKFVYLIDAISGFNSMNELEKISCPVLLIGSEGDKVLGPDGVVKMHGKIKNSELHLYGSEYGHGVYDEAPDHRERILRFFEQF